MNLSIKQRPFWYLKTSLFYPWSLKKMIGWLWNHAICVRERNSVTLTIIPMSLNFLTFFTNVRKQTVWQPHLAKVYLNYIQQNVWWKKNSSSFHRTWIFKSLLLPTDLVFMEYEDFYFDDAFDKLSLKPSLFYNHCVIRKTFLRSIKNWGRVAF